MKSVLETKIAEGRGGRIGRNILTSYAGTAVSVLTPLILIPLYTRWLGNSTYGQWVMIQSVAAYLGLGGLGTWQSVGNRITESVAAGRREDLEQLVSTAFFGYGFSAAILALISALVAHWIFHSVSGEGDPRVAMAFVVLAVLLLCSWPFRTNAMVLRGFERVDWEQAIYGVSSIGRIIGMTGVLFVGFKLTGIAVVQGGTILLYGIGAYFLSLKFAPEARPRLSRFSADTLRALAMPSLSFFVIEASYMLNFSVDNLVIGYVLGTAMVTAYSVPYRMLLTLAALFAVLLAALRPTLTTRFVRGERELVYSGLVLLWRLALLYASLVAFLAWLIGPEILRVWAGAGVFPGKTVFAMQTAVFMIGVLIDPPLNILAATTHHYNYSKFAMVEGLLNLGLSLWWVHYWGLAGVIGGTFTARLLTTAWYTPSAALNLLQVRYRETLRNLAPAALICAGAIWAALVLRRFAEGNLTIIIPSAIVGSSVIIALFSFTAFSALERRAAWLWINSRLARSGAGIEADGETR